LPNCFDPGVAIRSEEQVVAVVDTGTGAVRFGARELPRQTPLLSRARAKIPSHLVISLRSPLRSDDDEGYIVFARIRFRRTARDGMLLAPDGGAVDRFMPRATRFRDGGCC
jgi:hypothetical protein